MDENRIYGLKIMFIETTPIDQLPSPSHEIIHGKNFLDVASQTKKPTFEGVLRFQISLDGMVNASPKFKES